MKAAERPPMNEIEAIEACLHGNGEEFRLIVDAYKGPLTALAMNVLGNRQDAEDACQEAFIQAFLHLDRFDRKMSLRTWLFTILFRRCLDVLRKKRRFRSFFLRAAVEPPPSTRDGRPAAPESGGISNALLETLTSKERSALALWANEGLNSSEIAGILGCAASTARVYLFNGRRKIKVLLEKGYGTLGNR
jgi:RNA polymerase sigma-70 factor, ECF subfamily